MTSHSIRQIAGRSVLVHLPPGYDAGRAEPYPLIVLHDGQNLAAWRDEALGGSWLADETIDRLVITGRIPPVVLAGIDHAGEARVGEFTPTEGPRSNGGRASHYARWLIDDLIPALAGDAHVRTDFDGLTLGGSSLGGLVTLWIASSWPGRFGRLLAMSPSVWWDRRVILRHLLQHPLDRTARIWLDAGRREGRVVGRDTRALRDLLHRQGHDLLHFTDDPEGDHSEASWGRRFEDALVWLYDTGEHREDG
jgi:enterochelin esterase-like enzyme